VERVNGIGGVFIRSRDPDALKAWYVEHLGLPTEEGTIVLPNGGATILGVFSADTEYFGGPASFMLNFRVGDLDAILAQLREREVEVEDEIEDSEYGRFGWTRDPEGNRIELWEPAPGR
jgi:predicted enzyme related to lactoylglutathione lyase